eukprot:scaffold321925_cov32-Tisochrysis_lutea.AAC.3
MSCPSYRAHIHDLDSHAPKRLGMNSLAYFALRTLADHLPPVIQRRKGSPPAAGEAQRWVKPTTMCSSHFPTCCTHVLHGARASTWSSRAH